MRVYTDTVKEPTKSAAGVRRLRTSIRRLVSVIDAAQAVAPRNALASQRRRLKAQLRSLSFLRDIDVTRRFITSATPANPSLALLDHELRARRGALAERATRALADFDQRPLRDCLSYAANHLLGQPAERVKSGFIGFLNDTLDAVLKAHSRVSSDDVASIHRMRIAFKTIRYIAEGLRPVFSDLSGDRMDAMHRLHSLMGQIQDLAVIAAGIDSFGDSRNRVVRDELEPVLQSIATQRSQLISELDPAAERALAYWIKQAAAS